MFIVDQADCKFCEFPNLEPSIFDAPELRKSHSLHLLSSLDGGPKWDDVVRWAAKFAGK